MKNLKQIREEYESIVTQMLPEDFMLEAKDSSLMGATIPSSKDMPVMLLFRRISYRVYPNKQVVALYYSRMVDKYLSVPFGPKGNLNLNEATLLDNLDEDWQSVNRKDKTDGLSQKAVNAYRRENPGSKLKTAVTEKNPTGKRAARRKSFCSRMGGMKKRLTSAKTARDPDSRINKALRRWNCEESFKQKLYEKRMQQEGVADVLDAGAEAIVPYYSAGKKLYKGDYKGAATDAAVDTALLATGAAAGKVLAGGAKLASKGISKVASKLGTKAVPRDASAIAKSAGKTATKPSLLKRGLKKLGAGALGAGAEAAKNALGNRETSPEHIIQGAGIKAAGGKIKSSFDVSQHAKEKTVQKPVNENKIADIQQMINEGYTAMDLFINGRKVTLNTSMAKRILEVYDSVNTRNKKIVEGMINEDLESFKKLLQFSIRN